MPDRQVLPTLVEAVLAVCDGDVGVAEAGRPVQLAVVPVQRPVGAADGLVVRPAALQTAAGRGAAARARHAPPAQPARLMLTRPAVTLETCGHRVAMET